MKCLQLVASLGPALNSNGKRQWRLLALFLFAALLLPVANSFAGGTVLAWGNDNDNQCNVPVDLTDVVSVAGGGQHSLALKRDGTVVAWGWNVFGETDVPAGLTNVVAIAANAGYSLALQNNGAVAGWGTLPGAVPAGFSNVIAIAAGYDHELALQNNGLVSCWGGTNPPPANLSNVVAIAAGNGHSLALKSDGTITAWGRNSDGQTTIPTGATNIVAVAAGDSFSLALKSDGTVWAWGNDSYGQTDVPADLTNVVAIAAGSAHGLALKEDGKFVAWGRNDFGQAEMSPSLTGVVALAGGLYHSLLVVGDGSPVITIPPANQTVALSKEAVFHVFSAGNQPLSYQWFHNGTNLSGATSASCQISNVQWADAGAYYALVFNAYGSTTSAPAILTPVAVAPTIVEQPQDASALCGDAAGFQVQADGTAPFYYQWLFEGSPLPGATNSALALGHVTLPAAGQYSVLVSNDYGPVTSRLAQLTVIVEPPLITSPLMASGKQGDPFVYTITGLHSPTEFGALGLPAGLTVDPTNGLIQGTPLESGLFDVLISTANECSSDQQLLVLQVASSVPVITSTLAGTGTEEAPFNYQILATDTPTSFGADGLPPSLVVDSVTGQISGTPVYGGAFDVTIWASNTWGVGSATLHLDLGYAPISGLAIANLTTNYSAPYLLDFEFSLRDSTDPSADHAVVVPPRLLSVTCMEDGKVISPSETGAHIARGSAKQLKAYLVLDFTASIASFDYGDTNGNGISDAVDSMVSAADSFVDTQPSDALIGVYEFHREDVDPQQVVAPTTDRTLLHQSIDGIWTNYVQGFPAASRCWDALLAAITDLGPVNQDEQRYIIFISDGRDESSSATSDDVIAAAQAANVKIYCVGFGAELDTTALTDITSQTSGRFYMAADAADIAREFAQIGKDLAGQYIVRWATLKRGSKIFMPSFQISYQGYTADSPTNPVTVEIDDTVDPAVTNITTNFIISYFDPSQYAGDVTVGSLRLVGDALVKPQTVSLRATYIPHYIRHLRLQVQPNWPMTSSLQSTDLGEILEGWSLTETNDGSGGRWIDLESPSSTNYMPFAAFGNLVKFTLRDMLDASNAFSAFTVDNSIYLTNGPSFQIENAPDFITAYPVLPYGTPVPWLIAHGFTGDFVNAELSDPDGDGVPTWSEYLADTDPRDPTAKFAVQAPAPTGLYGHYQITFSTSSNRTYRVEASNNLLVWETLADNLTGTGADMTVTDPRSPWNSTQMYYRVVAW